MPDLVVMQRKLVAVVARRDLALSQVSQETIALTEAQAQETVCLKAQKVVQEVAEAVQQSAHRQISSVVTKCLEAVFAEDAYAFEIRFSQKRGRTEAELLFCRDGVEADPTTAAGGGVVDVAALALRLACLKLARPKLRQFLALDEPLRFLSREYHDAARALLLALCKEGMQILMVTHNPAFAVGKVVELE